MSAPSQSCPDFRDHLNELQHTLALIRGCLDALEFLSADFGFDEATAEASAYHAVVAGCLRLVKDADRQCKLDFASKDKQEGGR